MKTEIIVKVSENGFENIDSLSSIQIGEEIIALLPISDARGVPFIITDEDGNVLAKYKVLFGEGS